MDFDLLEQRRLVIQAALDAGKTQQARNKLGQFATPTSLAREIAALGVSLLQDNEPINFLDPAFGTGSFYSALISTINKERIENATGIELDDYYGEPAHTLWSGSELDIRRGDFTLIEPDRLFNLIICNPPYVRHHHLAAGDKERLVRASSQVVGSRVSGLSGLYLHFLLQSVCWMAPGGFGLWLVPSEFMDVNYGRKLKDFLCKKVTLLRIHRTDPTTLEFADALVSSAVVVFKNLAPQPHHEAVFSYGGTVTAPAKTAGIRLSDLLHAPKWTRYPLEAMSASTRPLARICLGDLFDIKRGIATGDNRFFIVTEQQASEHALPSSALKPILPSPKRVSVDQVTAEKDGLPANIPRLFLIDCALPEAEVRRQYPALWAYLERGQDSVAKGYLCSRRNPWYSQEQRSPAPILCTYMGRGVSKTGNPFRFIRNRSSAIGANGYLMLYPRSMVASSSQFIDAVWLYLSTLDANTLLREGRVYGGGLYKLEPSELSSVPLPDRITSMLGGYAGGPRRRYTKTHDEERQVVLSFGLKSCEQL